MEHSPITVLVADDQSVIRDGLSLLLGLIPGIEVVGTATDGHVAVREVHRLDPDVVLMDLDMPGGPGVEAIERLVAEGARTRIIVLTTYSDDASVFAALRAGARGYLTKDADSDAIRSAIRAVHHGDAQLDPSVQRRLLDALGNSGNLPGGQPVDDSPGPDGLSARERDVIILVAAGLSNNEIANELFVSEATVKTHINHLFAKTGSRHRAELVRYAFRHRLAEP